MPASSKRATVRSLDRPSMAKQSSKTWRGTRGKTVRRPTSSLRAMKTRDTVGRETGQPLSVATRRTSTQGKGRRPGLGRPGRSEKACGKSGRTTLRALGAAVPVHRLPQAVGQRDLGLEAEAFAGAAGVQA